MHRLDEWVGSIICIFCCICAFYKKNYKLGVVFVLFIIIEVMSNIREE